MTEETALVPLMDIPAMNLCSICPEPGHCCKGFYLYTSPTPRCEGEQQEATFWKDELLDSVARYAPFIAEVQSEHVDEATGRTYLRVWWTCPELQSNGRCGIYSSRPQVCRQFVPGNNSPLCVFHPLNRDAREALHR